MLIRIVSNFLESHRRLVIPQLGTFIVKEPGQSVIFSELLKRDDGVLRQLLCDEGTGEVGAAGEIDRFVFEVRHAVQSGVDFPLAGFGVFRPGENGTIAFQYLPQSAAMPAAAATEPSDSTEPAVSSAHKPAHVSPDKIADAMRSAFAEPRVSPSAKMNPDPSIRGLRYGKPHHTTDGYSYVDKPPRRWADVFVWIALAAAVIALTIIAIVYFHPIDEPVEPAAVEQASQMPSAEPTPVDSEATEESQTVEP